MKDSTRTTLADGRRISKDSSIAHAIGVLDEANAFIGLAKVHARCEDVRESLETLQKMIFKIGSEFSGASKVDEKDYDKLMQFVKDFENKVKKPKKFVILEKDESTAFLSVARVVVRRAERYAVRLYREGLVSMLLVEWLNKLNYLLYLMILREGKNFNEV
ncbi:cobalamin adenosyltransferase [Archaeoglobales archaeon ex4484_92]|nr:MAG: cobalamin adenosyltransferase [Archaeoglobales archaeon ex4484_92]